VVSDASVPAILNGMLVMLTRHALSNGTSITISTDVSPGIDPNRIGTDWLPNRLVNRMGRSQTSRWKMTNIRAVSWSGIC